MIKKAILEFEFTEESYNSEMMLYQLALKNRDVYQFIYEMGIYLRTKMKHHEPKENDVCEITEKFYELLNDYSLNPEGEF